MMSARMAAWVISPTMFDLMAEHLSHELIGWFRFSVADPVLAEADGATVALVRMRYRDKSTAACAYLQRLLRQPGATVAAIEQKFESAKLTELRALLHLSDRPTLPPELRAIATPLHDDEL